MPDRPTPRTTIGLRTLKSRKKIKILPVLVVPVKQVGRERLDPGTGDGPNALKNDVCGGGQSVMAKPHEGSEVELPLVL